MLEDIVKNTQKVFEQFLPQNKSVQSIKSVYDLYRAMQRMVNNVDLVSEHYLALDFEEPYLQNSSFGSPSDKWRYFFNKDLETFNKSAKKYLMKLNTIAPEDNIRICGSYLSEIYNPKTFYGFVRDNYSVGLVRPCGFEMVTTTLKLESTQENYYIESYAKIDLTTYEQRVALQSDIREKSKVLKSELTKLKAYILGNCTIEELL